MVFCNLESRAAQSKKNVSKTIALPTVGMNVCKRLYAVVGRRSWVLMKSMLTLRFFPLKEFQAQYLIQRTKPAENIKAYKFLDKRVLPKICNWAKYHN